MELFLMESIIRNRKKVYSVGNILTQTEINLSCMLEMLVMRNVCIV